MSAAPANLRVFHFISGDLWAGAETMAFNLLRCLKAYPDLDLSVILLNEGTLAARLRDLSLSVTVVDEQRHGFLESAQRIRRMFHASPPDIIHSHRYKENMLAVISGAFRRNVSLIATQHGLPELIHRAPLSTRMLSRANFHFLAQRFEKTVAVSHDIRRHLIHQRAFRPEKVEVIHNGIDIPGESIPVRCSGPVVVGSSGRLVPVKDYPLMIEIAAIASSSAKSGLVFELAGEGPERPRLEALISGYGLTERFLLRGHQDEMDSFYRGLDLYIITSLHEGIPMAVLEAMARGLPVVAPAVGGLREVVEDGRDGFLIPTRNPAAFAEKCLLLSGNPELRQKMSQAAREKAQRMFTAKAMADRYYRLYRRTALRPL